MQKPMSITISQGISRSNRALCMQNPGMQKNEFEGNDNVAENWEERWTMWKLIIVELIGKVKLGNAVDCKSFFFVFDYDLIESVSGLCSFFKQWYCSNPLVPNCFAREIRIFEIYFLFPVPRNQRTGRFLKFRNQEIFLLAPDTSANAFAKGF